jgi:hypothetical protein
MRLLYFCQIYWSNLFCIFFASGEEFRVTLWGDSARDFDELALHKLPSLVIIAFAGFRAT